MSDERVILAMECLRGEEIIYGEFEDHLYVVVHSFGTWSTATYYAKKCNVEMVTISSKAENDFVYELFHEDRRLLQSGYDAKTNVSYKIGPWIGLKQEAGGREPASGWRWLTGEPLTYRNWAPHHPSNHKKDGDYAVFWVEAQGRRNLDKIKADKWKDLALIDTTPGFVLEFE